MAAKLAGKRTYGLVPVVLHAETRRSAASIQKCIGNFTTGHFTLRKIRYQSGEKPVIKFQPDPPSALDGEVEIHDGPISPYSPIFGHAIGMTYAIEDQCLVLIYSRPPLTKFGAIRQF